MRTVLLKAMRDLEYALPGLTRVIPL